MKDTKKNTEDHTPMKDTKKNTEDTTASTPKQPVAEELVNDMQTSFHCRTATEKSTGDVMSWAPNRERTRRSPMKKSFGGAEFWYSIEEVIQLLLITKKHH